MKTRLDFAAWAKKSRLLDEAFPAEYKRAYSDVARQFAEHFQQKGWTKTSYQAFGNDKYYFKVPYFASQLTTSAGTGTSFWLLDEPVDFDDYMANAFFLGLVQTGVKQAKAPDVKFAYRTDVSQPEMTRGLWNDICNLWVCGGGAIRSGYVTTAVVRQKWLPGEEFWHYGGGPSLSAAPVNMVQAFLTSWASGSSGMLPWWTTEGGNSWTKPRDADLALFYTGRNYANSGKDYPRAAAGPAVEDRPASPAGHRVPVPAGLPKGFGTATWFARRSRCTRMIPPPRCWSSPGCRLTSRSRCATRWWRRS